MASCLPVCSECTKEAAPERIVEPLPVLPVLLGSLNPAEEAVMPRNLARHEDESWSPERDNGGNDRPALGFGKVKLLSTQNIAHARRAANKNWRDDRIGRRELVAVDAPQPSKRQLRQSAIEEADASLSQRAEVASPPRGNQSPCAELPSDYERVVLV